MDAHGGALSAVFPGQVPDSGRALYDGQAHGIRFTKRSEAAFPT
ncbi:hypothetical protein [Chachezhania sediminis]|nr:hypothetical protein [Chachezhania sediminis]